MLLKDVMSSTVKTIPSSASVRDAARAMVGSDVGFLLVIHEDVCAGVLTDRDIVVRVVASDRDPARTYVAEVMSRSAPGADLENNMSDRIASLPEDTPVDQAIQFMDDRQVRRVAVHDHELRIVGVVSRADLYTASANLAHS